MNLLFANVVTVRRLATLALLAVLSVGLNACSGNDSATNGKAHPASDAGGLSDAGGDASYDTGVDAASVDATGDSGPDADAGGGYDPSLADLGAPPTDCPTTVVNDGADGATVRARIFVPSYRLDFGALTSQRTFREHIHQLIHEKVLPCRAPHLPNVVVFPESMSLPMLLIGPKADAARHMAQSTQALTSMVGKLTDAFGYYGEQFPDTSIPNRLLLALTDTVVRATYDTFGQLADRYDLYVSVTVDLPDFEKTTDPALVARVGDPDYPDLQYAYVATSPKVHNRQILFGPDGKVVDETLKTYVTQTEITQLNIAPGDFTDIHLMDTPWGRTGVVISKPAWMPDVQDRLDDLGAEIIFQPEAFVGGWVKPLPPTMPPTQQVRWQPDVFMLAGWNLVQRSPRATHGYVAQLTGNFFELPADGQVQFIEKASRQAGAAAFVGQPGPLAGNTFIGPWAFDDPGQANPSMSLAQRRTDLRADGAKLLPGSGDPREGDYVDGMWAADLHGPDPSAYPISVQTHPQIAVIGAKTYVVSSAGQIGQRRLRVQVYQDGALASDATEEFAGYDVVRPTIAAGSGKLHIVTELIGDGENRLGYTTFDTQTDHFAGTHKVIAADEVGQWAFHPSIQVQGNLLHMSWIKRVGNANRAYYAQTSLDAPFEQLSVDTAIEARPQDRPGLRADQWDARVAVSSQAIAVTWMDFKDWQWEIRAAVSTDGGLSWSQPLRLDTVPGGVEAINSTPRIRHLLNATFAVAWTDARATRANTRVAYAMLTANSDGTATATPAQLVDADGPYDRWSWRPTVVDDGAQAWLVYQTLEGDSWSVQRVPMTKGAPGSVETLVDPSTTAKHFVAASVGADGSTKLAYEEVAPHTGGASQVRFKSIAATP